MSDHHSTRNPAKSHAAPRAQYANGRHYNREHKFSHDRDQSKSRVEPSLERASVYRDDREKSAANTANRVATSSNSWQSRDSERSSGYAKSSSFDHDREQRRSLSPISRNRNQNYYETDVRAFERLPLHSTNFPDDDAKDYQHGSNKRYKSSPSVNNYTRTYKAHAEDLHAEYEYLQARAHSMAADPYAHGFDPYSYYALQSLASYPQLNDVVYREQYDRHRDDNLRGRSRERSREPRQEIRTYDNRDQSDRGRSRQPRQRSRDSVGDRSLGRSDIVSHSDSIADRSITNISADQGSNATSNDQRTILFNPSPLRTFATNPATIPAHSLDNKVVIDNSPSFSHSHNNSNDITQRTFLPTRSLSSESNNTAVNTFSMSGSSLSRSSSTDSFTNPPKVESLKNDYSQHFVDTGERPQNFIRDADPKNRFQEYPKQEELVRLKNALIQERATPPMYIKCDLRTFDLSELGTKFDVILIDPPWSEYRRRCPGSVLSDQEVWTVNDVMKLRIDLIANSPSFIFIWAGSEEGIEGGRNLMKKWGFRRCEDIAWLKTNQNSSDDTSLKFNQNTIVQHTSEHCLMGIKGTVRRSTDHHFIHANVDTDIIISEQPPYGSTRKPEEMYELIERFCLGRRRIELFAEDHNIRPGWVSLGKNLTTSNYDRESYVKFFEGKDGYLLGYHDRIDQLRPKSPPRKDNGNNSGHGNNNADRGNRRGRNRGGTRRRNGMGRGGNKGRSVSESDHL